MNACRFLLLVCFTVFAQAAPAVYEHRSDHHPDGIGKFYMGREIAHVMGHEGASWLERDEREREEKPDLLVANLGLKPGQTVADVGAGTGYFSRRMAAVLGPKGVVYAVDIQQEMLDLLAKDLKQRGITNVVPLLGSITNVNLPPESLDLVLLVDVYHECSHPKEMLVSIRESLKPTGQLVLVEYRREDPEIPIKALHKMSEMQARKEAEANGFRWVKTTPALPRQHMIFFKKEP